MSFWPCSTYVILFLFFKNGFLNHLCFEVYCSDLSSQSVWNAWWNRAARDFACSDCVLFLFLLLTDSCQVNRVSDCMQMYNACLNQAKSFHQNCCWLGICCLCWYGWFPHCSHQYLFICLCCFSFARQEELLFVLILPVSNRDAQTKAKAKRWLNMQGSLLSVYG